jgi:hypothetical protein
VDSFETIFHKDGAMLSFAHYYKRFFGYWGKEICNFGSEQIVGILLSILILLFQIKEGLIPSKDAKIAAFATVLWPYVVLVGIYVVIHWVRTPWKLHELLSSECEVLQRQLSESNRQIEEIENAKPRIMLCDPDALHTEPISFSAPGMQSFFSATFVKARFINKPQPPYRNTSVASGVTAKLRFFDSNLPSKFLLAMDGRWDDTDQPSNRLPTQSKTDLLSVSFAIEGTHNVDVAFWDPIAKAFVAFNNDSYLFPPRFTKPGHVLGSGPIRAEIRLLGADVEESFALFFWFGLDGKVHVSPWSDYLKQQ